MYLIDSEHHILRHIKKSWMDGEFVEPAAFRLREIDGQIENGLSVNWAEFFDSDKPEEAVRLICEVFRQKGRSIGGSSKFAFLNVHEAIEAGSKHTSIYVEHDPQQDDESHALIKGYENYNDLVAEELAKAIKHLFPAFKKQ